MVVTEGDDVGTIIFDCFVFVFGIAKDYLSGPRGFFEIFEALFFVVIGKKTFDRFDGFVTRNNGDHFVAKFTRLAKKVFVAGVEVVEGPEDHD